MQQHHSGPSRTLLIIGCCLVPLAAMGATLFLGTPIVPTALVAFILLAPLAQLLLAAV